MKPLIQIHSLILYLIVTGLLSGCVNMEPVIDTTRFYVLKVDQKSRTEMASKQVLVRKVQIADYLKNSQLAERSGPNSITYLAKHRWAGSLDKMIGQIIAEEISADLPGLTATTSGSGREVAYLDISVLQFDYSPNANTSLILEYTVIDADSNKHLNRGALKNQIPLSEGAEMENIVALMERTLREAIAKISLGI